MSMLQKSRHWLAPLSIMLLGSTVLPASADSTGPVEVTPAGASVRADSSGDIHLRVSRELLTGSPENLREALLDVILNDRNHSAQPVSIDDDGKIHYLVSFGTNQAGSHIHLKPLPSEAKLEDAIANAVTGLSTILTLSVVDGISRWRNLSEDKYLNLNYKKAGEKHGYYRQNADDQYLDASNNVIPDINVTSPHIDWVEGDNFAQGLARNYANQAVLVSSFLHGDAVKDMVAHQVGPNETGRTSWTDILPDLSSTLAMGFSGGGLRYLQDYPKYDGIDHRALGKGRTVLDHVSMYNMSSTTNTMSRSIRKFHEALLNDVTELDDGVVTKIAQVAPILEGALALAALNYSGYAGPDVDDSNSYLQNFLPVSVAITAIYNFRDLTADLATEAAGDRTLGEFAATGALLASTAIPYLLGDKLGSYKDLVLGETAEASGFSLSMAIGMTLNKAIGGDPSSTQTRLVNASSGLAIALVMHTLQKYLPVKDDSGTLMKDYLKPVLGNAATGTVIMNTLDLLSLAKDELIKPYLVAPLLDKMGASKPASAQPALRLRAQVTSKAPLAKG
ncbi:hypothetical protein M3P05_17115 [Sansalvadorimonas sp. 2012CJ34-2]|uniref:Uncharacterized protein n=1 Tax=Parendozoicomonas callyspongiae TaxID=2942213 RepID=A0ABT0PJS1_9GAMM|nr:hypothetical protein [Sansalvadorimonas sp. 2012CJ34-2]MCL6271640.1 hypothetical protein [Sansalvadorimonas sp. 2012CJ34-2]